ncbi:DUF6415 family natural product biosynthesis protein [Streptomyces fradiae]|uniref:DUF6415 family natural product biosynthesis protein n=1 Tax=Streptomyces fradiae TaxID=1906 RepID=UPI002941F384|nr:DUF6415 family natural product biosynthesis protein [Streptomyces fradiae]WOI58590.1 DUF6415 family natural product biosynthesis protein [Streptomyces fradiae]
MIARTDQAPLDTDTMHAVAQRVLTAGAGLSDEDTALAVLTVRGMLVVLAPVVAEAAAPRGRRDPARFWADISVRQAQALLGEDPGPAARRAHARRLARALADLLHDLAALS